MAKLVNPLLSQDARGSVAGVQYSRNTYGNFASRKSTSTRSQRLNVTNWRRHLGIAQHAWAAASDADRATWDRWARPGLTPRSVFVGGYMTLASILQTGAVADGAGNPTTHMFDLLMTDNRPAAPNWTLTWDYTGYAFNWVRVSYYVTETHHTGIHRRKWKVYYDWIPLLKTASFNIPVSGNWHHFYVDLVDAKNGRTQPLARFDMPPV